MLMCAAVALTGCGSDDSGEEITLHLSYGDRTGSYTGDLVDGVPDGNGKFVTKNEDGDKWTYEGEFRNGHFEGEGKTTWENGQIEEGTYKNDVVVPLKGDEISTLYSEPDKFKNHCVELTGYVFTDPEYSDKGVAIQMYSDIENRDNNTVVTIPDKDFKVKEEDYVRVTGMVMGEESGKNLFGATVSALSVYATKYEIVDYAEAASPTLKEVTVNQTQEQYGYNVTVQKVEFAENETRVYLEVNNKGSDEFSVYGFNARIQQGENQFEEQKNYEADYPELTKELLPGSKT